MGPLWQRWHEGTPMLLPTSKEVSFEIFMALMSLLKLSGIGNMSGIFKLDVPIESQ